MLKGWCVSCIREGGIRKGTYETYEKERVARRCGTPPSPLDPLCRGKRLPPFVSILLHPRLPDV